ncbi:hypothetical protein ACF0H5_020369 [Mactra antiquata]
MHKFEYISRKERQRLLDKYEDVIPNLNEFVMDILRTVTFETFCFLLNTEGYKDITARFRQTMFALLYAKLPKKEMAHSKRTHEYYKTMKSCIDNKTFGGDVRQRLQDIIDKQNKIIMSKEDIPLAKGEFAMERKSAALVLLIQQHKAVPDRKAILENVYRQETNGIDKTTLEIVYHSKTAMTEAQAGNVNEAEAHIAQAKILCENCGPCFAVTSALHDIEYTYRVLYMKYDKNEYLEKVISEGDVALQSLQEEREDVQKLWQRILLLFKALSFLRIDEDFEVGDVRRLTKSHRERSRQILKEIKRNSGAMELRRTMVMSICLAALNEGDDDDAALRYAKHAVEAARKGGCFRPLETENIEKYFERVKTRKNNIFGIGRQTLFLILMFVFGVILALIAMLFSGSSR